LKKLGNRKHHRRHHATTFAIASVATIALAILTPAETPAKTNLKLNRQDKDPATRTMLYATTRWNDGTTNNPNYGTKRHLDFGPGSIDFGAVRVKRPPQLVSIERSNSWTGYLDSMNGNDTKWQAATLSPPTFLEEDDVFANIKEWTGPICVYIHGYDESFDSSMRDAAVVAYEFDRRGNWESNSLPILFSWPSMNKITEYTEDEASAEWSAKPFIDFIDKLNREKNENSRIYLVAHSLGTRLAFALLQNDQLVERAPIDKLILSASDYDYFQAQQRLDKLEKLVKEKIYVFVSDRDGPLITSHLLHGSPRLGRPFDAPKASTNISAYTTKDAWMQLLDQAANIVVPGGLNNPPEAAMWIAKQPGIVSELGTKSRFIDVSELVSKDAGHRIAWPLIASLLADDATLAPLVTTVVYKRPDEMTLRQNFGMPQHVYRFHRVVGQGYGGKSATP